MAEVEKIVRRARIGRWLLVVVVAATCLGTVYAIAVNVNQGADITNVHNDVTRLQKTPCSRNPVHPNAKCEHIRQALARGESIASACIAHQRVTGTKGRNCDHLYVDLANGGSPEEPPVAPSGGDASQTPTTATQQPTPATSPGHTVGGGQSAAPSQPKGGHTEAPSPPQTGSPAGQESPPPPSSTSSSTTTVIETKEPPVVIETAPEEHPGRETLGTVTAPADGTVEEVTGKACEVTGLLCTK